MKRHPPFAPTAAPLRAVAVEPPASATKGAASPAPDFEAEYRRRQ